jgi:hypothetical protein
MPKPQIKIIRKKPAFKEIKEKLNKINTTKNKSIIEQRNEDRVHRQNKILVDKLDSLLEKNEKETFSEIIKKIKNKNIHPKPTYTSEEARQALREICLDYVKEYNLNHKKEQKTYLSLDRNDLNNLKDELKRRFYLK